MPWAIVHGRVAADHVVVDGSGRPVLCGFSGSGRAGSPGFAGATPLLPADDVAGLGALLGRLVDGPMRRRRPPAAVRLRRDGSAALRRSLLALVAQATATDAALRPSAAAPVGVARRDHAGCPLPET